MEIRPLTSKHTTMREKLYALSYLFPYTEKPEKEDADQDAAAPWTGLGAFDDTDALCACVLIIHYQVNVRRQSTLLGGIGGVACRPENKRNGLVRQLLESSLRSMYDQGYVFSALYPFSHSFYRKFGFEFAFPRDVYTFSRDVLDEFYIRGSFVMITKDNIDKAQEVYRRFCEPLDFSAHRSAALFAEHMPKNPYADIHYAFMGLNTAGEPQSYVVFKTEKGEENEMVVTEMAYLSAEALRDLLAFLKGFNNHKTIHLPAVGPIDLMAICQEPYDIRCERRKDGMLRIVNVPAALRLLPIPPIDGTVQLGVTDDQLSENNGVYEIAAKDGKLSVTPSAEDAEMSMTVAALAQAISGMMDFDTLCCSSRGITGESENPLWPMLFPKKRTFLSERF